jgi:hypothetical protein
MKQIQPKQLNDRQMIAIQHVMIALKRVVRLLNETIDNYDRAMDATSATGESWQIGDHEFDELEAEE